MNTLYAIFRTIAIWIPAITVAIAGFFGWQWYVWLIWGFAFCGAILLFVKDIDDVETITLLTVMGSMAIALGCAMAFSLLRWML